MSLEINENKTSDGMHGHMFWQPKSTLQKVTQILSEAGLIGEHHIHASNRRAEDFMNGKQKANESEILANVKLCQAFNNFQNEVGKTRQLSKKTLEDWLATKDVVFIELSGFKMVHAELDLVTIKSVAQEEKEKMRLAIISFSYGVADIWINLKFQGKELLHPIPLSLAQACSNMRRQGFSHVWSDFFNDGSINARAQSGKVSWAGYLRSQYSKGDFFLHGAVSYDINYFCRGWIFQEYATASRLIDLDAIPSEWSYLGHYFQVIKTLIDKEGEYFAASAALLCKANNGLLNWDAASDAFFTAGIGMYDHTDEEVSTFLDSLKKWDGDFFLKFVSQSASILKLDSDKLWVWVSTLSAVQRASNLVASAKLQKDLETIMKPVNAWGKPILFLEPVSCPNGHPLLPFGLNDDEWACDNFKKCLRGIKRDDDTSNIPDYRCQICNYDLCDMCYFAWHRMQFVVPPMNGTADKAEMLGSCLLEASRTGNLTRVRNLVRKKANIDYKSSMEVSSESKYSSLQVLAIVVINFLAE